MSQRVISGGDVELTPGERRVLDLFAERLPDGWEIYVQPHMNGLRPDFVLLHPANGIAVFEVKDWDLEAMTYRYEGTPLALWANDGEKNFVVRDPIAQVKGYKDEIFELYCPSFDTKWHFGIVTAALVFTASTRPLVEAVFTQDVRNSLGFGAKYPQNVIASAEVLETGNLSTLFPLSNRRSDLMSEQAAADLRHWLVEPDFASEQRQPLELDRRQRELVTTRTGTGYRRIKGAAGSGKSVVLAARAAELAQSGKEVLVATYNITLVNYLRDLAVRWARGPFLRNITWLHYHGWAKRVCQQNGREKEYSELWHDDNGTALDYELPELVTRIMREGGWPARAYDAVLVDEAQDYRLSWWNSLRLAVKPGGEMLLVADPTQDVYGTARAWTEQAMTGAGFRGPWTVLQGSYRLPPEFVPHVRRFAEDFLPADGFELLPEPTQVELSLEPVHLRWVQTTRDGVVAALEKEILRLPILARPSVLAWADIVFLASNKQIGAAVVDRLSRRGFRIRHTFFSEKKKARKSKIGFFKGDPRLKATTLQSFKGWEGRALVVHLSGLDDVQRLAAAYAALTRLKRSSAGAYLTVVCDWAPAADYGRSWPSSDVSELVDEAELEDFDPQWRPMVAQLGDREDVIVEPGEEVMDGGRVVDLDLATVRRGDRTVRLVDDSRPTAKRVAAVLTKQGAQVLRVRPDEPDLVARILAALEE